MFASCTSRFQRRGPPPLDAETQLRSLIIRVGDGESPNKEITGLTVALRADIATTDSVIKKTLLECIASLPTKSVTYGVLLGILNSDSYDFVEEFLEELRSGLSSALQAMDFRRSRLLFRFIGILVRCNVLLPAAILDCLSLMEKLASDLKKSGHQEVGDQVVLIALSATSWVGQELEARVPEQFTEVVENFGSYIKSRESKIPASRSIVVSERNVDSKDTGNEQCKVFSQE